ncbi:MAG: acyl-CoA dehydrogenase [Myxococcales bacterium]|jgi:alkylation response protein AidB-like acyl-CoA dehydrogenase
MAEIELSEEQGLLARSAGDFLTKHSTFDAVRRRMETDRGFDPKLWQEMASLGWLGASLPEAHGGAGMPVGALVSLAEPMGRHLFASPWLATTLAGRLIDAAGGEQQKQRWLPAIAGGELIATVALTEPGGSWELQAPGATAARSGDGYALRGSKSLVLDAEAAGLILCSATLDDGSGSPAIFAVERAALPDGALRRHELIDERRRAFRLDLDGLQVPADARLDGDDAAAALGHVDGVGTLLLAAEMSGGTEGVMDLTLEYLRTRTQFGRPIGSYQALKHPMVEIMIQQELARSLLYHAATVYEDGAELSEIAVRMAKAQAGETYTHAADRSIQFHGAIGFTHECHAQLFFRHAQWAEYTFGDALHHRRRLEPLLLRQDGAWAETRRGAADVLGR